MRLFLSLELPECIKNEIKEIQEQIVSNPFFRGSCVALENLHCTLLFLGEVPDTLVPLIQQRLTTLSFPSFFVSLDTLAFNSLRHPHVLWVSLESSLLSELALVLRGKLPEWGDTRSFLGHITIARVKELYDPTMLSTIVVRPLTWKVTQFYLRASTLTSQGSHYTTVLSVPLKE